MLLSSIQYDSPEIEISDSAWRIKHLILLLFQVMGLFSQHVAEVPEYKNKMPEYI